jgi:uncharacterized protein YuzE
MVIQEEIHDHDFSQWYSHPPNKFTQPEAATMALATLQDTQDYLKFLPVLQGLSKRPFSLLFDPEADVLYIDFYTPPKSSKDSELTDDDIVIRYDDQNEDEIVGLTILNVSKR